jgi:hypothetical protein
MRYLVSAVGVVTVLLVIAIPSAVRQYNDLIYLKKDGKEAVAAVTSKECANHGRLHWELRTGEKTIQGISNNCTIEYQLRCEGIAIGSPLKVRYIEVTPHINDCESVSQKADEMLLMIGLLITTCLGMCIYGGYKYRQEKAGA